ncbi:hypothetical protein MNBD_GAMMA24-2007 [hydrothermal vent metagenome]|uniref:Uncharacterized protein n=1 Tax=hydrothermal vent metagenome TaxID=652676 RepID=A0A3B1BQV7_9ZZZZ
MEYWPWWLGAIGLAAVCILNFLLLGRLLGVSGSWAKVVGWRDNRERSAELKLLAENKGNMGDALLAETLAEFGEASLKELGDESEIEVSGQSVIEDQYTPWTMHFVFLLFMFIGGLLAALMSGNFKLELILSPIHSQIFGADWEVWLALLFGGIMVGFGTQMAGGCTSGHGLSGCARLIPASLVATMTFMVSAILLSFMMEATLR